MEGWAAILEWAEWRHRGLRGRDGAGHAVHPRAVAPAPREDPAAYLSACHPWPRDRLKIGIDAHFVGVREGGNERHFESIIRCLAVAARPEDEYFVFSYRGAARQRIPNGRLTHVPLRRRSVVWQRAVELPRYSRRLGLDVLHVPFNFLPAFRCRKIVTIHDLSFLHVPEAHAPLERARLVILTRFAARRADHVLTVSEFAMADIIDRYGVDASRITVTPNAVDRDVFRPLGDAAREIVRRLGLDAEYFLFVGELQPRKNARVLVEAYARLRARGRRDHHLVLAGRLGWSSGKLFRLVRDRELDGFVHHVGEMGPDGLAGLYSAATALVVPSLYESFGLPVLEAMSCGCPVVSSNAAALPEVCGGAALQFDPRDPDALADQLERVVDDAALRHDLIRRGLANCDRYSWERTAAIAAGVYHAA